MLIDRGNSHQIARPWHLDELRQGQTPFESAISLLSRAAKRALMGGKSPKGVDKFVE